MSHLLSPNSLCAAILRINKPLAENIHPNRGNVIKSGETVFAVHSQIREIDRELAGPEDFTNVLKRHGFSVHFDSGQVQAILSGLTKRVQSPQSILSVTLWMYFALFADSPLESDARNVVLMIQTITLLCRHEHVAKSRKLVSVFHSCYYHLMKLLLEKSDDEVNFVVLLGDFFGFVGNIDEELYRLLVMVGRKCFGGCGTPLSKAQCDLIAYFDSLIARLKDDFPKAVAQDIVAILNDQIMSLDIGSIMLLSHVARIADAEFLVQYAPILVKGIVASIEELPPTTKRVLFAKEALTLPDREDVSRELGGKSVNADEQEIDLTLNVEFPEPVELATMIRNDLVTRLMFIVKTVNGNALLCEEMIRVYPQFWDVNESYAYDHFAAYFYLFGELTKRSGKLPLMFLCNSVLFDPRITVFAKNLDNWERINTLRTMAVDFLVCHGALGLQFACSKMARTPAIFAELIHRFMRTQMDSCIGARDIPVLSKTITRALSIYQSTVDLSNEQKSVVNTARNSLYMLLTNLLSRHETMQMFFHDHLFISSFLSLLFDVSAKKVVLASLLKYLSEKNSSNTVLIEEMMSVFDTAILNLEAENMISACLDLMILLNEVVIMDEELARQLQPLANKFANGIARLPMCESSKNLLIQYLVFLANISKEYSINMFDVATLGSSIKRVFGKEPGQSVFMKIVQLMAGQQLNSFNPCFVVQQPKAMRLLVSVFSDSVMARDVLAFVGHLCDYDKENCVRAHDGEVDMLLIDILKQFRDCDSFDTVLVASLFSLLITIMNVACSSSTVQSFVSLLCQVGGKYLPSFHKLTVKSLNKLLLSAKNKPPAFLPLLPENEFSVEGFMADQLTGLFTVAFWIYLHDNTSRCHSQIITLRDSANFTIRIYLQGCSLFVCLERAPSQYLCQADGEIPAGKWALVTCSFCADSQRNQTKSIVSFDGESGRNLCFPDFKLASGPLSVTIGGAIIDSPIPTSPPQLGAVGIFPTLGAQFVPLMLEDGPASLSVRQLSPCMYFTPTERNGRIRLDNLADAKVRAVGESLPIHHPFSFTDILIDHCFIDILIPVFSQWDLRFKNGDEFQFLPATTVEVLENALCLSVDLQEQFASAGSLKAILHLMMASDPRHLTYQVYIRWFSLHSLMKSASLQKQILELVVMNAELWVKSDGATQRRILKHWTRTVVPSSPKIIAEIRPFPWVMSVLRINYWYQPVESTSRDHMLNVGACRSHLLTMAGIIARCSFTDTDLVCLISHILTSKDYQQSHEMLCLLKNIISEPGVLKYVSSKALSLIPTLQYLLNVESDSVICSTIQVIVAAHRAGLVKSFDINTHLDIILHQLPARFVMKSLLDSILDITESGCPELFPICSWIAVNLGDKGMRRLLNKVTPGVHLVTSEFWAIWLVVGLVKADEKLQRFTARYLAKCSRNNFALLFATIEVIGRALSESTENIKGLVCTEFGKLLLRDDFRPLIDDSYHYFEAARHVLFFRGKGDSSEALTYEFNHSVFSSQSQCRTPKRPVRSPQRSPRSEKRRRGRHSLCNTTLESIANSDSRYSPALAEKVASSFLVQEPVMDMIAGRRKPFQSKRTSLMVLDRQSLIHDNSPSIDTKIVSMMPADLDGKIDMISKSEFLFKFGLRLGQNETWMGKDLAEQTIAVFKRYPDSRCAETALTICAFLLHYNMQLVQSVLPNLSIYGANLGDVWPFFRHHAEMTNFYQTQTSCGIRSFRYLENFETARDRLMAAGPLRMLKHLMKFQADNSSTAFDIFSLMDSEVISVGSNFAASYTDKVGETSRSGAKMWFQYWNHFTVDYGPWRGALDASLSKEEHFKRDFTQCLYCPVKTRRNFAFDNHAAASKWKDCVSAKPQPVEQMKSHLEAQYDDAPEHWLELVEEKHALSIPIGQCIVELPCEFVTVENVKQGNFTLFNDSILLRKEENKTTVLELSDVHDVLFRTRFHHPTALEIFMKSGENYFINFPNIKSMQILKTIKRLNVSRHVQCEDFKSAFMTTKFTEQWVNRKISNFEYLMRLNTGSGRTFNDASQYPILPWVLQDYTSEVLNLDDCSIYRDLSKPMGALNEARLQVLKEKAIQYEKMDMGSYLYPSGYVCQLSVYMWLIRQEPYTTLHIDLQSGYFDAPARQFASIEKAFSISCHSQNDFRELIPEFFTTPEFLTNTDRFDFGSVDGEKVDNVELPGWAKTPFDFIYMNRKALESEYVSAHLHNWIDLIWGEKQRGEKAKKANNVFMPQMYDDIWTPTNLNNPSTRAEIEAILCHVGQVPPQMFDKPHPVRVPARQVSPILDKPVLLKLDGHLIMAESYVAGPKIIIAYVDANGHSLVSSFTTEQLARIAIAEDGNKRHHRAQSLDFLYSTKPKKENISNIPKENVVSTKPIKLLAQLDLTNRHLIQPLRNGTWMMTGSTPTELYMIRPSTGTAQFLLKEKSDIRCIAGDGEAIIVANDDAVLSVYDTRNLARPRYTIPSFTNQIQCCDVSGDYHLIVCGMRNGSLLLCSLNDGSIVRIVDLHGCRPRSVMVTKGWGFIVVYLTKIDSGKLTNHIALYSVNGEFLRMTDIGSSVATWTSYQSADGFDYIVMADNTSNIYHYEAYYLSVGPPLYALSSRVLTLSFALDHSLITAVSDDGSLLFLPYTSSQSQCNHK